MSDLIPKKKTGHEKVVYAVPEKCGVDGCDSPCDIFFKHSNIARCHKHYQEDVDNWGKTHKRGSATRNITQMMEKNGDGYRKVKSGSHLLKIIENLSQRGRREVS